MYVNKNFSLLFFFTWLHFSPVTPGLHSHWPADEHCKLTDPEPNSSRFENKLSLGRSVISFKKDNVPSDLTFTKEEIRHINQPTNIRISRDKVMVSFIHLFHRLQEKTEGHIA
jgi:hypothetical protein